MMMNKKMKAILFIVMAAGVALIAVCLLNYTSLRNELADCDRQLNESVEKWQKTAAEKEALQDDLKEKKKQLNIAQLELDSALEDAVVIQEEIDTLKKEVETLKQNSGNHD